MPKMSMRGDGFSISFSNKKVTLWGGLALLKQMLDQTDFRNVVKHGAYPCLVRIVGMLLFAYRAVCCVRSDLSKSFFAHGNDSFRKGLNRPGDCRQIVTS